MKHIPLAIAFAITASLSIAADVAILENAKRGAKEFDEAFAELGVETEKFDDSDEEIKRFTDNIDKFSLAISGPLFTYQKDPQFDAVEIRKWIGKGGILFMMDGSYTNSRAILAKIDPALGGLESDKCTSTPWAVRGYTNPVEPTHALRMFPNVLSSGDSWPYFEPVPEGSKWRPIVVCTEGKPVTYICELGKGTVVTTCLRHRDARTLENLMAFVTLKKAGLDIDKFSVTPDRPGPGHIEMMFNGKFDGNASLVYELTLTNGEQVVFTIPVKDGAASADFNVSLRGQVNYALYLDTAGSRKRLFSHTSELPPLLSVGPNAYRGILSTARRVKEVSFPVCFAPDHEKLGGAKVTLAAFASTGEVARTEFTLDDDFTGGEKWVKLALDSKLAPGDYRIEAKMPAFNATSEASIEIRAPCLA